MKKGRKIFVTFALIPILIILIIFIWFITVIFEGEAPQISLEPLPEFLSKDQTFNLVLEDRQRGLKKLKIALRQEGRYVPVLEKKFSFQGILNRDGAHRYEEELKINPSKLSLAQGRVDLEIEVWDFSRRRGGDGNLSITRHKMLVDTIPPHVQAISRMHNINVGGAGLVIYQTSSDTEKSGVYVNDVFFPGFPQPGMEKEGTTFCYIAVSHDSKANDTISLWAKDKAGNETKAGFYYHLRKKRYRKDRINISDRFLKRVLPYFSFYELNEGDSDLEKYLKINNKLRSESNRIFFDLREKTSPEMKWSGPWLSLKNAATMARFGDRRSYYYRGKKVDEKIHLGVDLASLANSPVQAANNGTVIFAERNGIYGQTVVIDHGQGIASVYSHLSGIAVTSGQDVKKGENIGTTGQTGLAGGDHLHFSVMINGLFVNPIEWWDGHWIKDNISKKLALLK